MPDRRPFAISAAILPITALVLYLMGRAIWCSCGSLVPWAFDVWSKHNSQHVIDPYTLTHVLHGLLFYALLWIAFRRMPHEWRLLIAVTLEAAWEILENGDTVIERYRTVTMSLDYYGDSIVNSVSDVIACAAGFLLAWRLPWRASLGLFFAVELLLILCVRDSFVLNVIMLVYPLDAIREWQSP